MDRKKRERLLHDRLASNYELIREKETNSRYYSLKWIKHLFGLLPRKDYKRILDIGCGTGIAYEIVKEKFPEAKYVGIDISKRMVMIGKRKYPSTNFEVMDCENLKFKENSFDLVIARSILHHLPHPSKAVAEIKRVVVRNGYVIISEPHKTFLTSLPRAFSKLSTKHFDKEHTHFKLKEFKSLFTKNGLSIIKINFFGYLAYPFAFPDVIPAFRYLPSTIFRLLFATDRLISKIPFMRNVSWHVIIVGKNSS